MRGIRVLAHNQGPNYSWPHGSIMRSRLIPLGLNRSYCRCHHWLAVSSERISSFCQPKSSPISILIKLAYIPLERNRDNE